MAKLIAIRSRRHPRHSSLLVSYRGARIMIDCGADMLTYSNRTTALGCSRLDPPRYGSAPLR